MIYWKMSLEKLPVTSRGVTKMIQRKGYQSNRRLTPIQLNEGVSLMSVGGSTDPEEEEKKEKEGSKEYDPTPGQQSYLDALEKSKTTAKERAGFLFDKPEKPEMDEERQKRFKNLTKAGAIAQLIDAVSDVAMGAKNQDYRPVPIAGDELAFTGMQQVYEMDEEHRNNLKNYKDQVFRIDNQNKRTEAQIDQQNEGIDIEKAGLEYQWDQEAQNKAEEIARNNKDKSQEWYLDMSKRLASNGEPEAGLALASLAGVNTEEAVKLLGIDRRGGSSGGSKERTVLDYYNDFYGRGEDNPITRADFQLLKRYRDLKSKIEEEGADVHYVGADGSPRTPAARDLAELEKELGALRFAPTEEELLAEYGAGPKKKAVGSNPNWRMDKDGLIDPETGQAESNKIALPKLGKVDTSNREGSEKFVNYVNQATLLADEMESTDDKMALADQIEQELKESGLTEEEILHVAKKIFGMEDDSGSEESKVSSSEEGEKSTSEEVVESDKEQGQSQSAGALPDDYKNTLNENDSSATEEGTDSSSNAQDKINPEGLSMSEVLDEIGKLESKGKKISLDEFKRLRKLNDLKLYLTYNKPKKKTEDKAPTSAALNFVGSNPLQNIKTNSTNLWKAIKESTENLGQRTDDELYQEYLKQLNK